MADAPLTILPPRNPPSLQVDFGDLQDVYHAGDYVFFVHTAAGAQGLDAELWHVWDDGFADLIERQVAVNGTTGIGGDLRAFFGSNRKNHFEVRLARDGAPFVRVASDIFVFLTDDPTCGDIAHDLVVDHADWVKMQSCIGQYALTLQGGAPVGPGCARADLNGDEHIDLRDQQIFQNLYGIGAPAKPPNCPIEP